MQELSRYGSYGVIHSQDKLLLVFKKSGPYQKLWDLPGGGIEFGETPEIALRREVKEEAALGISQMNLLQVSSHTGKYLRGVELYRFHHIGVIYTIADFFSLPDMKPEEKIWWAPLEQIELNLLTPFAKAYFKSYKASKSLS